MKPVRDSITALAFAGTLALPAFAGTDTPKTVAALLLDRLDAGQYDQAETLFDANMQLHVPADKLKSVWQSLPPAGERGTPRQFQQNDKQVVQQTLHRGTTSWTVAVAVDAQGKVSGFFVQPLAQAAPPPAIPADANYSERDITVGAPGHPLGGTLAMPKGNGPFPAVVLVHGSGPQDREETIGPNHVFTDIARGLAAQGIAILRYDKRTQARPGDFASGDITIDGETTDDAVAAIKTLSTTPGIDPKRIFVFGHSLGAMLAPRIAQRAGHVAGVIQLSGPARKLIDIIPYQQRYMAKLEGKQDDPQTQAAIAGVERDIAAIRGNAKPDDQVMGLRASYWRSVDAIDPLADSKAVKLPMLLLHGDRDFQVPMEDWHTWQRAIAGDARFTLKLYPTLNHMGIAGTGTPSTAEYANPGHVDAQLINDVADWIKAH
ncbi:alpha/beta hydrolase family protein [Solilutibacter silvestris]|nr:alpha/beta fold hydrolase [Lysobacter silvestris]